MSRAEGPAVPRPHQVAAALLVVAAVFGLDVLRAPPREHLLAALALSYASALAKVLLWGVVGVVIWWLVGRAPRAGARALGLHLAASLGLSAAVTVAADAIQTRLRPSLL